MLAAIAKGSQLAQAGAATAPAVFTRLMAAAAGAKITVEVRARVASVRGARPSQPGRHCPPPREVALAEGVRGELEDGPRGRDADGPGRSDFTSALASGDGRCGPRSLARARDATIGGRR
jgi:hypothetical protein